MGKITGLMGALATFGAVAYLMTPLPPQESSAPGTSAAVSPPKTDAKTEVRTAALTRSVERPGQVASAVAPSANAPSLVHQIQSELRRLGCYSGAVDGQWSAATQCAMQTLGERASVLRPVDTPDYIMLALARSQTSDACTQRQEHATAAAAPPIPDQTQTAARPRGTGSMRLTMSEQPAQSMPAQPWHITVQRTPSRRATDKVPGIPSVVAVAPTFPADRSDRPFPDRSRMGLGAVDTDPLRAGVDPRDPNAPAILRGPSAEPSVATAQVDDGPVPSDATPLPPHRASRAVDARARDERSVPLARQSRRAWQRNVFTEMQRNGP